MVIEIRNLRLNRQLQSVCSTFWNLTDLWSSFGNSSSWTHVGRLKGMIYKTKKILLDSWLKEIHRNLCHSVGWWIIEDYMISKMHIVLTAMILTVTVVPIGYRFIIDRITFHPSFKEDIDILSFSHFYVS